MAKSSSTKSAAARRSRKPSTPDVVRIGLQAATAKANMSHGSWKQIVNAAHGKGITVASALDPSIPDALKARTKTSLRTQADQTVNSAYKPQEDALNTADQQAFGLRTKRMSDESAFNSWYAQKTDEQNARIRDAQTKYEQAVATNPTTTQAASDQRVADLKSQIQQGAGGDMSNSVYLKNALDREQARMDQAKTANDAAVQSGVGTERNITANLAGVEGRHTAAIGGIEGDYGKTIGENSSARMKLTSDKAADSIKAYTDLLDQESSKASAVQNYSGLMAQLNQKADQADRENSQFYAGLGAKEKQSVRNANTSRTNASTQAAATIKVAQINADSKALDRDLKASEGAKNRNTQLRVAKMNHQKNPDGSPSDAARKYSQSQVQIIHTISQVISKYGSKFRDKNGRVTDTRTALLSRGYSGSQVNAGLWLAQRGHINDDLAKQLGILSEDRG